MLDLTVFEVVAKYNAQSRELAALRAERDATSLRANMAEARAVEITMRFDRLTLAYADKCARIAELEAALEPTLKHWLADDDPDELQPLVARVKATLSAGGAP